MPAQIADFIQFRVVLGLGEIAYQLCEIAAALFLKLLFFNWKFDRPNQLLQVHSALAVLASCTARLSIAQLFDHYFVRIIVAAFRQ